MATTTHELIDEGRVERFASRVAADQNVGIAGVLAYVGDRLGLWSSLAGIGWVDAVELAERTGLEARYVAEWLAAQAAAEYLEYDVTSERFRLPNEHALVLADEDSPFASAGGFEFQAGCWADADRVAELFVSGGGIAWRDRDPRVGQGAARFFRPLYESDLIDRWLASVTGVNEALEAGARLVDIGCGTGFATRLIAERFPNADIVGIDPDEKAIERARREAAKANLANLSFEVSTADDLEPSRSDIACFFDAFHHVGEPVRTARHVLRALAPGGVAVIVEPRSADTVSENLEALGPLYYSPSTLVCVPDALAAGQGSALGAQAGPERAIAILIEAGYADVGVAVTTEYNMVLGARRSQER